MLFLWQRPPGLLFHLPCCVGTWLGGETWLPSRVSLRQVICLPRSLDLSVSYLLPLGTQVSRLIIYSSRALPLFILKSLHSSFEGCLHSLRFEAVMLSASSLSCSNSSWRLWWHLLSLYQEGLAETANFGSENGKLSKGALLHQPIVFSPGFWSGCSDPVCSSAGPFLGDSWYVRG